MVEKRPSRKAIFANVVLAGGIAYFLSLVALVWSHYMISLAGAAVFAAAMCLHEERKAKIALLTVSASVSVYAAEICLALLLSGPNTMQEAAALRNAAAARLGMPFDGRSKYEVVVALRAQGIEAYPHIPTAPHEFVRKGDESIVPLAGLSRRVTVYCNENGEYVVYQSDEHGFNNPEGSHGLTDLGIVLVGDSFAEGACVSPEENLAGHLRKLGHKVLNLGRGGIGPLLQLAVLTEYAAPVQPAIVLWIYYEGNDLYDLRRENTVPLLRRYLKEGFSARLKERQIEIDGLLGLYVEQMIKKEEQMRERSADRVHSRALPGRILEEMFHLRAKIEPLLQLRHLRLTFQSFLPPSPLFKTVLKNANQRVLSWGGRLVFVYLPEWKRYGHPVGGSPMQRRQGVLSVVNELSIPLIDFHAALTAYHDPLALFPLRMYGHYNADGYRLLALRIDEHLRFPSSRERS